MEMTCDRCNKKISNRQYLVCTKCKQCAHIECMNVSDKRFYLLTPNRKANWKCSQCIEDGNTVIGNCSSSPINKTETPGFVTKRKKYVINVSTENSFSSLLDDEDENCQSTLLSLNRSCPDLNPFTRTAFEELQEKNNQLQEQLASADNEVAETLSENCTLKKKILEYEIIIKKLSSLLTKSPKKINTSTRSSAKISANRKGSSNRKKLDFSLSEHSVTPCGRIEHSPNKNITDNDHIIQPVDHENNNEGDKQYTSDKHRDNTKKTDDTTTTTLHKLLVIGEERLSGLSAAITKARRGKWNDIYTTFGFTMQYASSMQISEYCGSIENGISEGDVVILGIGSHDSNPEILHKNVCIALSRLSKATVYILPVLHNPHLNENTLNYHLKLWSKSFKNCTLIDIPHNSKPNYYYTRMMYLNSISKCVNFHVDSREYELQYIHSLAKARCTFIKNRGLNVQHSNKKKVKQCNSGNKNGELKKGTIPYYFKVNGEASRKFFRSSKEGDVK